MTDPTTRATDHHDDIDDAVRAATRALERIARSRAEEVRPRARRGANFLIHSSSRFADAARAERRVAHDVDRGGERVRTVRG